MTYSYILKKQSLLSILLNLCLLSQVCAAAYPNTTKTSTSHFNTKGTEAHPVVLNESIAWLVADHQEGITWIKDAQSTAANTRLEGQIATLDWRFTDSQKNKILIAAIDNETSAIHLITFDTVAEKFFSLLTYKPSLADTEALCLGKVDEAHTLYYVNALGQAKHVIIDLGDTNNPAKMVNVRELNVGENIKDCSIDDVSETLFLVEEQIGIWQYDARAEGQLERSLITFDKDVKVESISALDHKHVAAVSADVNEVWVYGPARNDADNNEKHIVTLRYTTTVPLDSINAVMIEHRNSKQILLDAYSEVSDELTMLRFDAEHVANDNNTKDRTKDQSANIAKFSPKAETQPVARFGDAADDPAIWLNTQNPAQSLVYGTDKKSGLNVYKLNGELIQSVDVGRINNIDIRKGVMVDGRISDVAVASNRTHQSITVFEILPTSGEATYLGEIKTNLDDVYGICLFQQNDVVDVIINDTSGTFNRYRLNLANTAQLAATKVFTFSTQTQPEGCIVDDENGRLFYGEESQGVWQRSLNDNLRAPSLIAKAEYPVQADIEGMGIYKVENESFLVVSSQGNNRFAVYRVDANNELLGVFEIGRNMQAGIDAVSETDGLEVTNIALGDDYPKGLLVVQDGHNVMPLAPQNFKLVSGEYLHDFIVDKR